MPTPSSAIATPKPTPRSEGWMVHISRRTATVMIDSPHRTMVRVANISARREPATEARNIATETGSILMPVSSASNPSTNCR